MSWRKLDLSTVAQAQDAGEDAATASMDTGTTQTESDVSSSRLLSVASTDREDVNLKFFEPSHRFANLREKLRAIR
jgi:hypothetical protein